MIFSFWKTGWESETFLASTECDNLVKPVIIIKYAHTSVHWLWFFWQCVGALVQQVNLANFLPSQVLVFIKEVSTETLLFPLAYWSITHLF